MAHAGVIDSVQYVDTDGDIVEFRLLANGALQVYDNGEIFSSAICDLTFDNDTVHFAKGHGVKMRSSIPSNKKVLVGRARSFVEKHSAAVRKPFDYVKYTDSDGDIGEFVLSADWELLRYNNGVPAGRVLHVRSVLDGGQLLWTTDTAPAGEWRSSSGLQHEEVKQIRTLYLQSMAKLRARDEGVPSIVYSQDSVTVGSKEQAAVAGRVEVVVEIEKDMVPGKTELSIRVEEGFAQKIMVPKGAEPGDRLVLVPRAAGPGNSPEWKGELRKGKACPYSYLIEVPSKPPMVPGSTMLVAPGKPTGVEVPSGALPGDLLGVKDLPIDSNACKTLACALVRSAGPLVVQDLNDSISTSAGSTEDSLPSTPRTPGEDLYATPLRGSKRVLVIGPGFGIKKNPRQVEILAESGYKVSCIVDQLPDPETQAGFNLETYVPVLQEIVTRLSPDVVACASKGGIYLLAMWRSGVWRGPSVMINRHPDLKAADFSKQLSSFVLAHGSNDKTYNRYTEAGRERAVTRDDLEELMRRAPQNRCMLYYTGDSGTIGGGCTRNGDEHDMASLLTHNCLPRLVDAALSMEESPEVHLMRSWIGMLHPDRQRAERDLGFELPDLRQRWTSEPGQLEKEAQLVCLAKGSDEYDCVDIIFRSGPQDDYPAYYGAQHSEAAWKRTRVVQIQRVENAMLLDDLAQPAFEKVRKSVTRQDVAFQPGLHTRWLFHGTRDVNTIVTSEQGLEPLCAGKTAGILWGRGSYLARDARYSHDSGFCPQDDGTMKVMLCLVATGMSCLGAPDHIGVLPQRLAVGNSKFGYNSTVDSLSNPEIFVTPLQGAVYPAYVITFASQ